MKESIPAEWTSLYWQWIMSVPKGENPLSTGVPNKMENFIALPCTGGGEDCSRTFEVPLKDAGKDILIPVFTCAYTTGEVPNATSKNLLLAARNDLSDPVNLEASVDLIPLEKFYVETSDFEVNVPAKSIIGDNISPGSYKAVSVGYWAKVKNLSIGMHRITFGGTGRDGFHTKVSYKIYMPATLPSM